jgi:uncharacterized protein (TIGR01777 family)
VKVVIPGGSGQVGGVIARSLGRAGHEIVILTRGEPEEGGPVRQVRWDAASLGDWAAEVDGADVVINLAGRSVNTRYTDANRRAIMDSRVDSTRAVGEAIARAERPPPVWLQASTATIYAHRFDAPNDEHAGLIGGDEPDAPDSWAFSVEVARAWERTAAEADTPHTRLVLLRTSMLMSPDRGGIFDVLAKLVRRRLGGPVAGGRQYVSWIHHEDFVRALLWLIEHEEVDGPVNLTAPNPLPQADLMRALREAAGVRVGLPATSWMAAIGALAMRTETELVLKSRRVVPRRLLDGGFDFEHPDWPEAARDLHAAWTS